MNVMVKTDWGFKPVRSSEQSFDGDPIDGSSSGFSGFKWVTVWSFSTTWRKGGCSIALLQAVGTDFLKKGAALLKTKGFRQFNDFDRMKTLHKENSGFCIWGRDNRKPLEGCPLGLGRRNICLRNSYMLPMEQ